MTYFEFNKITDPRVNTRHTTDSGIQVWSTKIGNDPHGPYPETWIVRVVWTQEGHLAYEIMNAHSKDGWERVS